MHSGIKSRDTGYGPWIEFCTRAPAPKLRLFCFHHAGGSALVFRDWHKHVPNTIEICPVELPGRGRRRGESLSGSLLELSAAAANGIQPLLKIPFAFFGYSMGAAVAFETARRLQTIGTGPRALVVAAAGPPHRRQRKTEYWKLPREALIEKLRSLNSTPEQILGNPELIDYFLAIVRADFKVLETSRTESGAKIGCPIVALAGSDDADGSREEMLAWCDMTTGPFSFSTIPGDHSFVLRKAPAVIDHIRARLAA